jgi:hypothetical protein
MSGGAGPGPQDMPIATLTRPDPDRRLGIPGVAATAGLRLQAKQQGPRSLTQATRDRGLDSDECGRCPLTGAARASMLLGVRVVAEQLTLPTSYGTPNRMLGWQEVEQKLAASKAYWLATTRPDGRPHTVPVDGIWWEGALYFGGDPDTVHIRNLRHDPRAVIHTESGESPVIAEGTSEWRQPSAEEVSGLVTATKAKYGYQASPDSYRAGTWRLSPVVVLAWNVLYQDATRFTFA